MKIKSIVNGLLTGILFLSIVFQTGCERAIIYPGEMTQTARASALAPSATEPPPAATATTLPPTAVENTTTPEEIITDTETPVPPSLSPSPTSLTPSATRDTTQYPPILYYSQSGDTRLALAKRFRVGVDEITSPDPLPDPGGLIQPNQLLIIPDAHFPTGPIDRALPDSEIIYSVSAADFDTEAFVNEAGGYLATYQEWIDHWYTGAEIIERVALENSISPRIFLSLLEYQSHWVYGKPSNLAEVDYPMGYKVLKNKGLYLQLTWAARMLSTGYYSWRTGDLAEIKNFKGELILLAPQINAGTVALQYFFSRLEDVEKMAGDLYGENSLPALHNKMFGDPWQRAQSIEPLFPPHLEQPNLELPFPAGHTWTYTGGPHYAWFPDAGCLAAVDFAPPTDSPGCTPAEEFVTSVGPGIVTRSDRGVVAVDMDMDGLEQTGWTIFYLHIANEERVPLGTIVNTNDPIGHASCVGGDATGTHLHIVRKYNGEWMAADGPVPFVLSGWRAVNGPAPYRGNFVRGDVVIQANENGGGDSLITRPKAGEESAPILKPTAHVTPTTPPAQ
ncbi:MAG: M23 family metallopeptidase [Anaerolineae bacterium]|nr:M23 family metallopeptidase [Anaerolineae bacterium]